MSSPPPKLTELLRLCSPFMAKLLEILPPSGQGLILPFMPKIYDRIINNQEVGWCYVRCSGADTANVFQTPRRLKLQVNDLLTPISLFFAPSSMQCGISGSL